MAEQTVEFADPQPRADAAPDYEVVVIGAGVAGIYQIKRLQDLGIRATVLEANPDLGGTWYHNRYPGARFDSESFTYGYSFSRELLDEWHWTEQFSPQPETLRYLEYVTEKFGLREHMQFDCRVEAMAFDAETDTWTLRLRDGRTLTTRFVATALGVLSIPTTPQDRGDGQLRRTVLPLLPLAPRPHRPHRQARRGHRYGRDGHPAHPRGREGSANPDRVPAAPELGRAPEQRAHLRVRDGRDPRPVRRDLRHVRPYARGFRTRAGPAGVSTT